jgi:hypothetical protein
MTKRKAMLLAAGLVATLLGSAVAMALGLSGGGSAVADTPKRLEPIVKVRERTVKVEKKAKGSNQPVQVVNLGGGTSPQKGDDDSAEHGSESYEDDHGSEDLEDEGHEVEDQASEEHEDESGDD